MIETSIALERLKILEPEFRRFGIKHLSLFGSRVRGDATRQSDFDFAIEFGPDRTMSGFEFAGLEHRMSELLGSRVDLVIEPARKPRMQREIDRFRRRVF